MSLYNVQVSPGRAVVAADTAFGVWDDGEERNAGHVSKMVLIPHLQAVFVFRGSADLFKEVAAELLHFDAERIGGMVESFGDYFHEAMEEYRDINALDDADDGFKAARDMTTAALVGVEDGTCMAVLYADGYGDFDYWGRWMRNGVMLGGADDLDAEQYQAFVNARTRTVDRALGMIRHQYGTLTGERVRDQGCGGHVTVAEIEPDGIRMGLFRDAFEDRPDAGAKSVQTNVKVGRNAPCPCGSGRKHKRCCLGNARQAA